MTATVQVPPSLVRTYEQRSGDCVFGPVEVVDSLDGIVPGAVLDEYPERRVERVSPLGDGMCQTLLVFEPRRLYDLEVVLVSRAWLDETSEKNRIWEEARERFIARSAELLSGYDYYAGDEEHAAWHTRMLAARADWSATGYCHAVDLSDVPGFHGSSLDCHDVRDSNNECHSDYSWGSWSSRHILSPMNR